MAETKEELVNLVRQWVGLENEMKKMSLEKESVGRELQQTLNRLQAMENLQPAGSITQHSAEMNNLSNKASSNISIDIVFFSLTQSETPPYQNT